MSISQTQIETALAPIIQEVPTLDANGQTVMTPSIIPSQSTTHVYSVPVSVFTQLFANAASISASDLLTVDGGTLGYTDAITAWQTAGYLT